MDRGIRTQVALYIEVHRVISGGFGCDFKEVLPEVVGFEATEVPVQNATSKSVAGKLDEGVISPAYGGRCIKRRICIE